MSQSDYSLNFDQAINTLTPYFREKGQLEMIGAVTAITWLLGGMSDDLYLYFLSMVFAILVLIFIILSDFFNRVLSVSLIHQYSFRRLIIAILANWMYSGSNTFTILDNDVPVNRIADNVMVALLVIWFATRYSEGFAFKLSSITSPLIIVRGILRGGILAGLFLALFSSIPDNYLEPLLICYVIEPFVFLIYAGTNRTASTSEMVLGNTRLPAVALRESFLSNLVLLLMTGWFDNDLSGSEWSLLRVFYIFGLIFAFISSIDAVKKFNENPLGSTVLGSFLNDTPGKMNDINLEETLGHIIDQDTIIETGKSQLTVAAGSILVPLEEKKGMVTTMVMGKTENIVEKNKQKIGQTIEGVTTALIPAKNLKRVKQDYVAKYLNTIDLTSYKLPSLAEMQVLVTKFSQSMEGWIGNVKNELTKFKLSNYGVTEFEGNTTVNLPGIFVNETPAGTQVKVLGIRVFETPQVTNVRIGNLITVVEFPKMQLVSLPGITVMEMKDVGTAVDLFGFKISDNLSAERLTEFKEAFLTHLDNWEAGMESQLGRIIADKNATAILSMNWNGEFKPILASKSYAVGDHPALSPQSNQFVKNLLPGMEERPLSDDKVRLIELTGVGEKSDTKKITSSTKHMKKGKRVKHDVELGAGKFKKSINNIQQDELSEVKDTLEKAKDEIDKKLQKISDEIEGKDKPSEEFEEIFDADYEIVDEEDE
ncbi:MAG: hypothetical protein ACW98K_01320 [Candidatus Kariarchaeaceae archaeon]|jgi:hypothetical protein